MNESLTSKNDLVSYLLSLAFLALESRFLLHKENRNKLTNYLFEKLTYKSNVDDELMKEVIFRSVLVVRSLGIGV